MPAAEIRARIRTEIGRAPSLPLPIAHELSTLVSLTASADPASLLLQTRDLSEVLIKFPALVLASDLADLGPETRARVRSCICKRMSLGDWIGAAVELARIAAPVRAQLLMPELVSLFVSGGPFIKAFRRYAERRNADIGHGAFRPDGEDLLATVANHLFGEPGEPGIVAALEQIDRIPWNEVTLAADPFTAAREASGPPRPIRSLDRGAPERAHRPFGPASITAAARAYRGGRWLTLSPLIAFRWCEQCQHVDLFFYDAADKQERSHRRSKSYALLDYSNGHSSRRRPPNSADLDAFFADAEVGDAAGPDGFGSASAIVALEGVLTDLHYDQPDWLRAPLRSFLKSDPACRLLWMEAPADVGKSTFVRGLIGQFGRAEPILDDHALWIVPVFFRREYRSDLRTFCSAVESALRRGLSGVGVRDDHPNFPRVDPEADDPAMALAQALAAAHSLRWQGAAGTTVLILDGLDETENRLKPGDRTALDFVPQTNQLVPGVRVVLMSRPLADCPTWVVALRQRLQEGSGCETFAAGTDYAPYRALLAKHIARRMQQASPAPSKAVVDASIGRIITAANSVFLAVSFLTDRALIELSRSNEQPDAALSGFAASLNDDGSGPAALYDAYLDRLVDEVGSQKVADEADWILASLAAVELAWGGARDRDTAFDFGPRGEPVFPHDADFPGAPLGALAVTLGRAVPVHDGAVDRPYSLLFALALYRLQALIGARRDSDGPAGFRLRLKGMTRRIAAHPRLAPLVRQAHAAIDGALEAASAEYVAAAEDAWPPDVITAFGARWLEHAMIAARSRAQATTPARWLNENRERLAEVFDRLVRMEARGGHWHEEASRMWFRFGSISSDADQALLALDRSLSLAANAPIESRAPIHAARGIVKEALGDGQGALDDYRIAVAVQSADEPVARAKIALIHIHMAELAPRGESMTALATAIQQMQSAREGLLEQASWRSRLGLAIGLAYAKLGNAKQNLVTFGPGAAISDYDEAVRIITAERETPDLPQDLTFRVRDDLATALMNRGVVKHRTRKVDGAIADLNAAVDLWEGLRDELAERGSWPLESRISLGRAYVNRGSTFASSSEHGFRFAVDDYGAAIKVMSDVLLEPLDQATLLSIRNDLAAAHMNRANAFSDEHRVEEATEDYHAAIRLREEIRAALEPQGLWTREQRNDLAVSYINAAKYMSVADAIGRLDPAIREMEMLRGTLEPRGEWDLQQRESLAAAYMSRASAKLAAVDPGLPSAMRDINSALRIRLNLRGSLEPKGDWGAARRRDLAIAYTERGNLQAKIADRNPTLAMADYDEAIALLTSLEPDQQDPNCRTSLAAAYVGRGNMNANDRAVADCDDAVDIMLRLRSELEPKNAWGSRMRNDLAGTFVARSNAKHRAGLGAAAAVEDLDEAIELREGLRGALEPVGAWSLELQGDLALALFNRFVHLQSLFAKPTAMFDAMTALNIIQHLPRGVDALGSAGAVPALRAFILDCTAGGVTAVRRIPGDPISRSSDPWVYQSDRARRARSVGDRAAERAALEAALSAASSEDRRAASLRELASLADLSNDAPRAAELLFEIESLRRGQSDEAPNDGLKARMWATAAVELAENLVAVADDDAAEAWDRAAAAVRRAYELDPDSGSIARLRSRLPAKEQTNKIAENGGARRSQKRPFWPFGKQ